MSLGIVLLIISALFDTFSVLVFVLDVPISKEIDTLLISLAIIGLFISFPGVLFGWKKIDPSHKKRGVFEFVLSLFAISLFLGYIVFRYVNRLHLIGAVLF